MKRIAFLTLALMSICAVLIASGCGPMPNNGNANANANANANVAMNSMPVNAGESSLTSSACTGSNINDKLTKVTDAVAKDIKKKSGLQTQIDNGTFKYLIQIGPGSPGTSLDMYLEGAVGGKDNFADLVDIIKDFVKSDCTNRVIFVKKGTLQTTVKPSLAIDDFQWFVCDDGTVPCPGGVCKPQCLVVDSPTPSTKGETNSGSGSGSSSNGNNNTANSRAGGNRNAP